jgi:hypothetical protein
LLLVCDHSKKVEALSVADNTDLPQAVRKVTGSWGPITTYLCFSNLVHVYDGTCIPAVRDAPKLYRKVCDGRRKICENFHKFHRKSQIKSGKIFHNRRFWNRSINPFLIPESLYLNRILANRQPSLLQGRRFFSSNAAGAIGWGCHGIKRPSWYPMTSYLESIRWQVQLGHTSLQFMQFPFGLLRLLECDFLRPSTNGITNIFLRSEWASEWCEN